jgi:hypothetical protein
VIAAAGPFTAEEVMRVLAPHLPGRFHPGRAPLPFPAAMRRRAI